MHASRPAGSMLRVPHRASSHSVSDSKSKSAVRGASCPASCVLQSVFGKQ